MGHSQDSWRRGLRGNMALMTNPGESLPRLENGEIDLVTFFRSTELFADLAETAIERIAGFTSTISAYRGQAIVEEGEKSADLYLVLDGRVEVQVESISPFMEIGLSKLGAGEVFGELGLIDNGERASTIIALVPGEFAVIRADKLRDYFNERPDIGLVFMRNLARILGRRLNSMNRRVMNYMRARHFR